MRLYANRFHFLLLCTTAIMAMGGVSSPVFAAFDPNAGDASSSSLPDTSVLYDTEGSGTPAARPPRPLYPARAGNTAPQPITAFAAPAPAPSASTPITATAAPPMAAAPAPGGFIAPAPVLAIAPPPAPVAHPPIITPAQAPVAVAAAAAPMPPAQTEGLSTQTKTILAHVPSKIDTAPPAPAGKPIAINRLSPEVQDVLGKDTKVAAYDAVGISIKVRRPGLDANYELNRAYVALMGGDTEAAVTIYKDILSTDPSNQDALFGLATTYHRLGELDKARPLYGILLKINPNHRDGLNNFLALVSDESPQEALAELERLEQRNPDFSPIPAQEAVVLSKMGYADRAREKMLRAIELSPDNLTYKYNLAVMLDTHGDYADASALYRLLIKASTEGQKVPSSVEEMQKRLNFITTAAAERPMSGV